MDFTYWWYFQYIPTIHIKYITGFLRIQFPNGISISDHCALLIGLGFCGAFCCSSFSNCYPFDLFWGNVFIRWLIDYIIDWSNQKVLLGIKPPITRASVLIPRCKQEVFCIETRYLVVNIFYQSAFWQLFFLLYLKFVP